MSNDHELRARLREAPQISIRQVTRQDAPDTDRFNSNREREMARRQAARSPSNPVDILSFVIQVTCYSRFLNHSKAAWSNMYATAMARDAVFNFLTLVPTCLLVARLVWVEFAKCISILRHSQFSLDSMDEETIDILLDSATTIVVFAVATYQIILSLQDDNQTSVGWESYKRQVHTVFYTKIIGFFLTYVMIFTTVGGIFLPILLAVVLYTATTLLPIAIADFSWELARANPPTLGVAREKVADPLCYGFLLALVVHVTDTLSCFPFICFLGTLLRSASNLCDNKLHSLILEIVFVSIGPGLAIMSESGFGIAVHWRAASAWHLLGMVIFGSLSLLLQWVGKCHLQVAFASRNHSADRKGNGIGLMILSVTVCIYVLLATISVSGRQWLS